jgi:hypothetical protein
MARLSKAEEEALETYGFVVEEPPEQDSTRRSRYEPMWDAARAVCQKMPGKSLKVRSYNNASTAYNDAKAINNGEKKGFEDVEDGYKWTAVAGKNEDVLNAKDEPTYDLYLKYESSK